MISEKILNEQLCILKDLALQTMDIHLTEDHLQKFAKYTALLLEWNEKLNLTSITDPAEVMIKHFLDSLVFVQWVNQLDKCFLVGDLGTGAGFPGLPMKILLPDIKIVLIDSLAKRLNFLNEVISELKLPNIQICHSRAEDIGRNPDYREKFDIITARAVAELPILLEYASPLLKVGGRLIAAKGVNPEKEIEASKNAFNVLNCHVEHLVKYKLADSAEHRALIIVQKKSSTSQKYPRQAGKPKKSPL
jgi:16S rRNA (guanine527-N7)-methyltransferase